MPDQTQPRTIRHVSIIPDGNRRWARRQGLAEIMGHERGLHNLIPLLDVALDRHLDVLTFWGFSTENASRSPLEVKLLMTIFERFAREYGPQLIERQVRFRAFGRLVTLPKSLQAAVHELETATANAKRLTIAVGLNYGGRDELLRAIRRIVDTGLSSDQIDESIIQQQLDLSDLPDPDLVIRTSGEQRLSGFMPWQTAYSELYFAPVYFPDFSPEEFTTALDWFEGRDRRFGK